MSIVMLSVFSVTTKVLCVEATNHFRLDPTSILYIEKEFDLFLMWCIDMQINSSLTWFHPVWCASFLAEFWDGQFWN